MAVAVFKNPDQVAKSRVGTDNSIKGEEPRNGDDSVDSGALEHGYQHIMGNVERNEDGSQVLCEAAGEESGQELDRVWEIDGDTNATLLSNVLADEVDLSGNVLCEALVSQCVLGASLLLLRSSPRTMFVLNHLLRAKRSQQLALSAGLATENCSSPDVP